MGLDRFFNTPTIEIEQSRYNELVQSELKYKQYKCYADKKIANIIEGRGDKNEQQFLN